MLRVALPLSRSVAAADNGERGLWQQLTATVPIKQRRGVGDLEQRARIQVVGQGDDEVILYCKPLLSPRHCLPDIGRVERFPREGGHVRSKLAAFSGEDRFG